MSKQPGKTDPRPAPSDAPLSTLEDAQNGVVCLSVSGFTVRAPTFTATVDWERLTRILCYKRDLVATDILCLGFACAPSDPVIEAHAEMDGFLRLQREAERRCAGLSEGLSHWLLNSPAFDTTVTCVWKKPNA